MENEMTAIKSRPQINNAIRSHETRLRTKSDLQRRLEEDVLMASRVGDTTWLQQSLETANISLTFTDSDGLSAIHLAALDCQLECLELLVEKMKVDVNHKSPDGWTCLHLTINNLSPKRSLACVNYLLSCGADPSSATSFGITPMHQAAACGNVACLQSLIESGGVIDGEDERGHTPYSLATLWGYRECARILKHYQWEKNKRSEDVIKRQMLIEKEEHAKLEEEKIMKEKAEKRLKGQRAYQLWLSKNQLAGMPLLFGQHPILDDDNNDIEKSRSTVSRQKTSILKSPKPRKSTVSRGGTNQERMPGASKRVDFIPINGPGSPIPGRRHLLDYDKRSVSNLTSGRIKAVQKRGPLQFPVI